MKAFSFILLLISAFFVQSINAAEVHKFGIFSNEVSNGDHSVGFTVHLWETNKKLIGLVQYQEGELGSGPRSFIKNVKYNRSSSELSFSAELEHIGEVRFSGRVSSKVLKGDFNFVEQNEVKKAQILNRCCDNAPIFKNYPSYENWFQTFEAFL